MKPPKSAIPTPENDRKKRLADALRQNLRLRKARTKGVDAANQAGDTGENAKDGKSGA